MFHLTGIAPEAVSFFRSCGLDPAWLQPSVQSESQEINGMPICPNLAQSLLIFSWTSHKSLARYPFRILSVPKLCHLLLRSTNGHICRGFKKKKKAVKGGVQRATALRSILEGLMAGAGLLIAK